MARVTGLKIDNFPHFTSYGFQEQTHRVITPARDTGKQINLPTTAAYTRYELQFFTKTAQVKP